MSIILFTTKNKQNPLNPVQLSNRKNPAEAVLNQRQVMFLPYGLKHGMCSGIPVYRALKKQCVEMTAAERNSLLTFRLVRAA